VICKLNPVPVYLCLPHHSIASRPSQLYTSNPPPLSRLLRLMPWHNLLSAHLRTVFLFLDARLSYTFVLRINRHFCVPKAPAAPPAADEQFKKFTPGYPAHRICIPPIHTTPIVRPSSNSHYHYFWRYFTFLSPQVMIRCQMSRNVQSTQPNDPYRYVFELSFLHLYYCAVSILLSSLSLSLWSFNGICLPISFE